MSDNDSEIISTKRKSKTKEKNNVTSKKPRKILTGKQKKMLCQFARDNPNFTQQELADKFEIGRTTVANILAQSLYWLGLDEKKIDKFMDSESLVDLTNEEEIELENLITQFQNSKNPENPKYLNISTHEFIEIEKNYTTGEMPTVEDIIAEIQENEPEEEPEQQIKPVTAIQAITDWIQY
ncbi:8203_t:CDS:2 [Cetraspora pellucida]|uniref:8203_t:CDS:1 n=1 Tax=Cetraspora pellucida TaxID=1433469 RepID=A0ACA9K802_9GLOM|nr:8203_t:CDS:2 [Cetraspora pellucida]